MTGLEKYRNKLEETCSLYADKTAIVYLRDNGIQEEWPYRKLIEKVHRLTEYFSSLGLHRGDRVAVLIPLSSEAYITILALAYFGATSVIPDVNLHEEELRRLLAMADVQLIVATQEIADEKLQMEKVAILDAFREWKRVNPYHLTRAEDFDEEAMAILFSSGTTSRAKGVVIGYEEELNATSYLLQVVGTNNIRYLMLFPNSHISGFTDFLVLLLEGGTLATMENRSPAKLGEAFREFQPNTFGMVPKVWETFQEKILEAIEKKGKFTANILLKTMSVCGFVRQYLHINIGRVLFKNINDAVFGGKLINIHMGGGKAKEETKRFFWNLGYNVSDFYASTETNIPITVSNGHKFENGVGNANANPNAVIRIWNHNQNGIGEIQVKSNMLMKGYFRDEELTEEAFCDGYFKTGDLGKIVRNQLYVAGRKKESIHLQNGEKVSPEDIENAYRLQGLSDVEFAVCGVRGAEEPYDKVYVFIVGKEGEYDNRFQEIQGRVNANYRYKKRIYVADIPKTSVGKVKRYRLKEMALRNVAEENGYGDEKESSTIREAVEQVIFRFAELDTGQEIKSDMRLCKDLGIESLGMFQICSELEAKFGTEIAGRLPDDPTIEELAECIENRGSCGNDDIWKYPLKRGFLTKLHFALWQWLVCRLWTIELSGADNFSTDGNLILCSNHQSHIDGLLIFSGLRKYGMPCEKISCMAKKEHLEHWHSRMWMRMLGAVPVDRYGNTLPALRRCREILKAGYYLLIHPEGARTRNGRIHAFKQGAAELSVETGVPILPIRLDGAYEIFPATHKLPRIGRKHKIKIVLGERIEPAGKNALEITRMVQQNIQSAS